MSDAEVRAAAENFLAAQGENDDFGSRYQVAARAYREATDPHTVLGLLNRLAEAETNAAGAQ